MKPYIVIEEEIIYLKNRCKALEKAVIWLAYDIANQQIIEEEDHRKGDKRRKEYIKRLEQTMELTEKEKVGLN